MYRHSQSKSFLLKRRNRTFYISSVATISLVAWLLAFSQLSRLPALSISEINVHGTDTNTSSILQATVLQAVSGDYLGLFSKANAFLYSDHNIRNLIDQTSAKIDSISIKRNSLTALTIEVLEKKPRALVCLQLPDPDTMTSQQGQKSTEDDECYLADANGFIFDKDSVFRQNDIDNNTISKSLNTYYMPDLMNNLNKETIIGKYATSTAKFIKWQEFVDNTRRMGINIIGILVKEGNEYEMYFANTQAGKDSVGIIYFNEKNNLELEMSNLISFWKRIKESSTTISFEYIDLRYGSNVFYSEER